jgi:hypothetical protein
VYKLIAIVLIMAMATACATYVAPAADEPIVIYQAQQGGIWEQVNDSTWIKVK